MKQVFPCQALGFQPAEKLKNVKSSIIAEVGHRMDIDTAAMALRDAKENGHTGIGVSDIHIKHKFKSTRENSSPSYFCSKICKEHFDDIEFYAEDAGRADQISSSCILNQ